MTNCTVTTGGRSCLPMADFGGHWLFGWQHTDARRTCRETVIARVNLLLHTKHCPVGRNDAIQPRRNVGLRPKARQWSSPDGTRPLVLVLIGQHHLFRRWEEGAARSETAGELVGNLARIQETTAGPRTSRRMQPSLPANKSRAHTRNERTWSNRRNRLLVPWDFIRSGCWSEGEEQNSPWYWWWCKHRGLLRSGGHSAHGRELRRRTNRNTAACRAFRRRRR